MLKLDFFFFLTYGQHFLICEVKQDIFCLVKLLFRKLPSNTNCQSEVLKIIQDGTLISPVFTCFKKFF